MDFKDTHIEGISSVVPKRTVDNDTFSFFSSKERKFFEKTVGIFERRWTDDNQNTTKLAFEAALSLIKDLSIQDNLNSIKQIIFVSQTPDQQIPFTSNILQGMLQLSNEILAIDMNSGCSGFIQSLTSGFSLNSGLNNNERTLIVLSENLSKRLNLSDKSTSPLFGDGAAAIMLKKSKDIIVNSSTINNSDGLKGKAISLDLDSSSKLAMNGAEVFDFTLNEVVKGFKTFTEKKAINLSDVDYFLFHQSNNFIISQFRTILNLPQNKILTNIQNFGNTSSVSIPLLISDKLYDKKVNTVLMSGYGSGLNWGNFHTSLAHCKISKPRFL